MKKIYTITSLLSALALLVSCGGSGENSESAGKNTPPAADDHVHGDDEVSLGTFDIGGISVEAAQGHGNVEAGKEGHLVIKLPYKDNGATVVRAWIGTDDRTLSSVGKGEYAPSHDDYDIHAIAPSPLPVGTKWWLELENPDGAKSVGSIPLLKDVK